MKTERSAITAYPTKDGSIIRELMHPAAHNCSYLSLAEAEVAPGMTTELHMHAISEEIYHIIEGTGIMTLGKERFALKPGDTVVIPPLRPHRVENSGSDILRILCCCAPAYSHEDTVVLES